MTLTELNDKEEKEQSGMTYGFRLEQLCSQ